LKDDRRAVIGGGLAILTAVFDTLDLDTMQVANGALRHGVLYDMLSPEDATEDLRSASITRLCKQFNVDTEHAQNVSKVALYFYDAMQACDTQKSLLQWAAFCHEIGWAISHTDCNKHGAYILDNTELMGFAQSELHTISLLVMGHQGKLRKLAADFDNQDLVCQLMALRLAVIFCHSRRLPVMKHLQLNRHKQQFTLTFSTQWAQQHPQTHYLLEEECQLWQKLGWQLETQQE
jgi:exopolyphosphatase / guanosine-5'-triphosphate,3'-diphosphate pyrophosphatase